MGFHHHIETAMFDIAYDKRETILASQSAIDEFVSDELMNVVEEVFDKAVKTGLVCRIPRLEIDLGIVASCDYEDEMPRRLREQLGALLDDIMHASRSGEGVKAVVLDKDRADMEELCFFLNHGYLPWYSRHAAAGTLDPLLSSAESNPAHFIAYLNAVSNQRYVIERLFGQFSTDAVKRLCRALLPRHQRVLQTHIDSLTSRHQASASARQLTGVDAARMGILMWQCLIEATMQRHARRLSGERLFQLALNDVFDDRLRIDHGKKQAYIEQLLSPVTVQDALTPVLENLCSREPSGRLDEHGRHDGAAGVPDRHRARRGSPTKAAGAWLMTRLDTALRSGDGLVIQPYWARLRDHHAPVLTAALFQHGQRMAQRQRIAAGFAEEMLFDMVELIEPCAYALIGTTIEHSGLFYTEEQRKAISEPERRTALWAYALGYLLVEHNGRFSREAYLDSIIRQMASDRKLSRSVLQALVRASFEKLSAEGPLTGQLAQLLTMAGPSAGARFQQSATAIARQVAPFRSYQRLIAALNDRVAAAGCDEQSLLDDIARLERSAPWLLVRIPQELRAGNRSLAEGIAQHYPVFIRRLADALTTLMRGSESTQLLDRADRSTPDAGALKATALDDLRRLRRLVTADGIDFDSIGPCSSKGVENHDTGVATSAADRQTVASQGPTIPVSDARAEKIVVGVFTRELTLTDQTGEQFSVALAHMLNQQPDEFLSLLEVAMADERFIDGLAASAPDWLQVELLSLLGIRDCADMLKYVDTLNAVCCAEPAALAPTEAAPVKWRFIHAYLTGTGRLFDPDDFVRQYIELLMARVGLTDLQQYRSLLIHRLRRNRLPVTGDITQRLVEILCCSTDIDGDVAASPAPAASESSVAYQRERDNVPEDAEDLADSAQIAVTNAGIVLAAPYLPRLFEMLDLVRESVFISPLAAERGVHMLQYLVDEAVASPEYRLVLNKLMCGVNTARPILRDIELGDHERELLDSLLLGMIQNWKALGNTSIDGLRESFLQRNGTLWSRTDDWHLTVAAKPFDMLLDQLPWSYSTIKLPWMDRPIFVEWR